MRITAIFILLCGFSMAEACLETPKTISLKNSPFPFSSFSLTSQSFEYVTSDGMINTLRCQEQSGAYSWGIATNMNGSVTEYGYEEIKAARPFMADSNETANQTPLTMADTASAATALFAKQKGQSAIQLTCSVVGNIMTMNVGVTDNSGRSIATVRASKMVGTRSIGFDQPQTNSTEIDFSSSQQQTVEFAGCGVSPSAPSSTELPASSTTTPIGQ